MENVLAAIAVYFTLPFFVGGLMRVYRAIVDGVAWAIHGPQEHSPPPELPAEPETSVPIPLARLGSA